MATGCSTENQGAISIHSQSGAASQGGVLRKIDLHVHTVPTYCDAAFTFSLPKLKEYVSNAGLGAIANHNCFDLAQFKQIVAGLQTTVLRRAARCAF